MTDDKPAKPKKGLKHWALFCLRWGIAIAGIWLVVSHMSLRDQAWVILNQKTMHPQQLPLAHSVPETSAQFPVVMPNGKTREIPRDRVVNEPDQKTVTIREDGINKKVQLLGLDLFGDLNHSAQVVRTLVADNAQQPARWVPGSDAVDYTVKVPHPRDQIGLDSMIHNARPGLLWAAIFVFPLTFFLTSYRWNGLLAALGINVTQGRTFVLNMVGCFYNTFMPGSTGGDVLKAYYASKQTTSRTRAVMSVLVDRTIGLLALVLLGGIVANLEWSIPACRKIAYGSGAIWACVFLGMLVFYNRTLRRRTGLAFVLTKLPMQKQVSGAVNTLEVLGRRPLLGMWALMVSLPVQGTVIVSAMCAGMAFGLPLHWQYYWVAVPVIVLAGAIPISPQGAGVMEAFAVLMTQRQGATVSQAFALAMSMRLVQVIWNLTGGIFVLRGGYHAPPTSEESELDPANMLPHHPGSEPAVSV